MQLLLKHGADARIKDEWGNTALAEAVTENRKGVQQILTEHGKAF